METYIITGASAGFGEALAQVIASAKEGNSQILLISRSPCSVFENRKESTANLLYSQIDVGELDTLESKFTSALDQLSKNVSKVVLVNNAATLGPIGTLSEITDYKDVQKTVDTNITSIFILNSIFLRYYSDAPKVTVVDISSGAANMGMGTWGLYCAGKSARLMLTRVLADELESKGKSNVKFLSYSPGIMDTKLQKIIKEVEVTKWSSFTSAIVAKGRAVPVTVSATELFTVIETDDFKSGDFVELYKRRPEFTPTLDD